MIGWLLRLFGLRRKRRRVYIQPPLPPPTPTPARRRHKNDAAMPLPPGYIQARGQAEPSPPPALPPRKFGPSSMPLPPGQLQGPSAPEATRARAREAAKEGRLSPSALVRALEQPAQTARRNRPPGGAGRGATGATPPLPPPRPRLRQRLGAGWARWRPRLRRAGRFGLLYGLPAAIVLVAAGLVVREMRHVGVVVMPFTVPAPIAASGRTPDVLAQHLVDHIARVRRATLVDLTDRPADAIGPAPPVGLPAPLLSRRGIATRLRDLLAAPVERVTGDVVAQPDGRLALRLHMTGGGEIAARAGIAPNDLDEALQQTAAQVWRIADPVLYAWYLTEREPRPAVRLNLLRALLKNPATDETLSDPAARQTVTVLLGRAMIKAGDPGGALALLDDMGPPARVDPLAVALRASAELQLGRVQSATESEERVLSLAPHSAWAHKSAAAFFLNAGRFNDALAQARAARAIAPNDGAAAILETSALVVLHNESEAIKVARSAIQLAPEQPGVQESLGNVLLGAHRPDLALPLFDSELKRNPGRLPAMIGRIRALQALHRFDEALTTANEALQIVPNDGTTLVLRAFTLLALKRPQDALAGFDVLLNSRPDMPMLLQGKVAALIALDRKADALALLERLSKLIPNNKQVQAEIDKLRGQPK